MYNHHDYDCDLIVNDPFKSGSKVRAYAYWNCSAEPRARKTSLRLILRRNFTVIDESYGGWLRVTRQSRSVSGPCASGGNIYYARALALVEFADGSRRGPVEKSPSSFITCD